MGDRAGDRLPLDALNTAGHAPTHFVSGADGTKSRLPRDVIEGAPHPSVQFLGNQSLVLGRLYLTRQAAALLRFASSTSNPGLAAALVERAVELKSQADERASSHPDASPYPPDVEDDAP